MAADRPGYVPAAPVFAAKQLSRCSGILCPAIRRVQDRASMGRVPSEQRARGSARPGVNAAWGWGNPAETEALEFLGAPQTH